jgi:radical SAM protein with 4Fe4S-binding SPASM domain
MNVLVYGTGEGAANILSACRKIQANILAYIDDDLSKHGQRFNDKEIISSDRIDSYPYDKIILATDFHVAKMEERLRSKNVPRENVFLYPGYREPSRSILALDHWEDFTPPKWDTLQLPLTNRCNLWCAHCDRTPSYRHDWTHSLDQFSRLLSPFDARRFGNLLLSGYGEITLLPHLAEYREAAQRMGWKRIQFVTNGTQPRARTIERLFAEHLVARLFISTEAASAALYQRIRGSDIQCFHEFLDTVAKAKRKHAAATQLIMNVVCMKENLRELPQLVSLARAFDLDEITFVPLNIHWADGAAPDRKLCVPQQSLDAVAREEVVRVFRDALHRADKQIRINLPERFPELEEKAPMNNRPPERLLLKCFQPLKWIYVGPNGDLYPCCQMGEKQSMGNVHRQSFETIWNGENYARLLTSLRPEATPLEVCRRCTIYNGKNF